MEPPKIFNTHRLLLTHQISPTSDQDINLDRVVFAIMVAVIILCAIFCLIYKCFLLTTSDGNHRTEPSTPSVDTELDQIPVVVYGESTSETTCLDTISEAENCAICLEEYVKGVRVRVLPKCNHMFHKECIEEWLSVPSLHCPICRDRVLDHRLQSARTDHCRIQRQNLSTQFPLLALYGGTIRNTFA